MAKRIDPKCGRHGIENCLMCQQLDAILADPERVLRLLNDAYSVGKSVHNYGDWDDGNYYPQAAAMWEAVGDFLYPDEGFPPNAIDLDAKPREINPNSND